MASDGQISTWAFGVLVRKLRYKQRRPHGSAAQLTLAVTLIVTIVMVIFGVSGVVALRFDRDGAAIVAALMAVTLVAWTVLPIAFAAGNTAVDPQLYAMYPISRSTLGAGLLSAAFISLPALGSMIVALSTLFHAPSLVGGAVIGFAAVLVVVTAVLSAQTTMVFFSHALQRRSTKDFAAVFGAVVGFTLAMLPQIVVGLIEEGDNADVVRPIVSWLNNAMMWLPWGWAPLVFRAGADERWGRAIVFGALAIGWIGVLFQLWSRALAHALVERPARASQTKATALVTPRQERLLGSPLAASAGRSRREMYRDARQLTELAGWLPLVILAAIPGWDAIRSGADELVLSSAFAGAVIGTTSLNLFGYDGPAFGLDVLVDDDLGIALRGKLVARLQLGLLLVTIVAVALAAVTGGWRFVPTSIVFAMCGLLAELAIGAVVSVRYPYPVPPKAGTESMFYNPGCFNQLVRVGALVAALFFILPLIGPAMFASIQYSAPAGFALALFGLALAVLAYRSCVGWSERRLIAGAPEMFQALASMG